jgi:hypothetical protein
MSRPRPTERVRERIEKIGRGASKGTHAEQKTTGGVVCVSWEQQTHASRKILEGFAKARQGKARLRVEACQAMKRRQLTSSTASLTTVSTRITVCFIT